MSTIMKVAARIFIVVFALVTASCGGQRQSSHSSVSATEASVAEDVQQETASTGRSDTIADTGKTVVLDFYATWCPPCRAMAPTMEEMEKKYADKIEFKKIDIDQEKELAAQLGIEAVPTLVILSPQGEIIHRLVGYKQADELDEVFRKL